jgi:hypothetical protein
VLSIDQITLDVRMRRNIASPWLSSSTIRLTRTREVLEVSCQIRRRRRVDMKNDGGVRGSARRTEGSRQLSRVLVTTMFIRV